MASRVVEGYRIPLSLDSNPVLDFCNTRAGWGSPAPREYLLDYSTLVVWAREAKLITPATSADLLRQGLRGAEVPIATEEILRRTIDFRGAVYDILAGTARRNSWRIAAAESSAASAVAVLRPTRPVSWEVPPSAGLVLPLLAIVRAADALLGAAEMTQVRACPMPDCGWLFPDPRGLRRWCSMALCGNRAKARRHAQRQRDDISA